MPVGKVWIIIHISFKYEDGDQSHQPGETGDLRDDHIYEALNRIASYLTKVAELGTLGCGSS
jgi:hypothetical protein